jgi:hypothetical protein
MRSEKIAKVLFGISLFFATIAFCSYSVALVGIVLKWLSV